MSSRQSSHFSSRITDLSMGEVTKALAHAIGSFESLNLTVGIDFTKSNKWKGARSFNGRSLHHIEDGRNPYEQAISIIGKTFAAFDKDILCFGFGDATTCDQDVFSFYSDETTCKGSKEVLRQYKEIVPHLRLAGPTSFAPIIEMTMSIVKQRGGQYHILVIIADGQVTRMDAECGKLSPQEQKTVDAIIEASKFPLSIILVGVGDGPWDMMKEFEEIPARDFNNFQFVNFTDIMTKDIPSPQKEAAFAHAVLMEIPSQYKAIMELNLLRRKANAPHRVPLIPPPIYDSSPSNSGNSSPVGMTRHATSFSCNSLVAGALAHPCLESPNLIVGIDFTKSNEGEGARSFNRRSLHHIGDGLNPYEQALSVIGKTLYAFDEDNLVPFFGFGDETTLGKDVFSFFYHKQFCNGFEEALRRYRALVPHLRFAGPTSFAPIIEMAMTIVEQSGSQYHVLVVIVNGQVTRSVETERGELSPQQQETVEAIVKANKFPLSIIFVGVGDGPWDVMNGFDAIIPNRDFDNFHFVNFTEIMSQNISPSQKEEIFSQAALMKIPSQYKAVIELDLLGGRKANAPPRIPLPPPMNCLDSLESFGNSEPSHTANVVPIISVPPYSGPATSSTGNNQICPICMENTKDMAFLCGHQTCGRCGQHLERCPFCRSFISHKIKLY